MLVLEIVLLAILFVAWVVCLFLLVMDSIQFWQKVVWFLALTILAPIGIPAYLLARRGRSAQATSQP